MIMYSLELSLRYSPFPISIQKKEFDDVKGIYDEIKSSMNETLESSNLSSPKLHSLNFLFHRKFVIHLQILFSELKLEKVNISDLVPTNT